MTHICILGAGFGGLYTALELSQRPWDTPPEITLVDRHDRFVFLPLLYELLTGEMEDWEVAPKIVDLLMPPSVIPQGQSSQPPQLPCPIGFIQGEVSQISLDQKQVTLADGKILAFDCLVLALGGITPVDQVPGSSEYALPFRGLSDVQRLRQALHHWEKKDPQDQIRIAIAGAGASGIELACKLKDRLGARAQIRLIDRGSSILRSFTEASIQATIEALKQRQIRVELNTEVLLITSDRIQTRTQDLISQDPVDGVIWTVGTEVAPVVRDLPLAKNERHQLRLTSTLQTLDRPEIFALGDLALTIDAQGNAVPATAQAAFQQASYCAWNVWAYLTHRPLLPFRYEPLGEMLSLGTDTAVLSGLGLTLSGPFAYIARRLVYLSRMPTLDHQVRVGWNWMTRPFLTELKRWMP
jgi:NADH dehydrogenase